MVFQPESRWFGAKAGIGSSLIKVSPDDTIMLMKEKSDSSLETLLDLDGLTFNELGGEREIFAAKRVTPSEGQPFGVKYSLVLLSKDGQRLIGYDNSHGYAEHLRSEWDHRHEAEVVTPYEYTSAGQLLEDFWADVDRRLLDDD